jgi:putative ABC transport system ATP-binding protein
MLAIAIHDLLFKWPGAAAFSLAVPELQIACGEKVFLLGASGSGKSTLLNLIAGVLTPQQGSIRILDTDFSQLSARQKDRFRARHIGLVFQQFNLIPYLDVETNIRLASSFVGSPGSVSTSTSTSTSTSKSDANAAPQRMRALLEGLQLDPALLKRRADSLSVGQQQRVAIARAMINQPALLIADEPTSALDTDARDSFMQLLLGLQANSGTTIVFVSHDRSLASGFDRVVDMRQLVACQPLQPLGTTHAA